MIFINFFIIFLSYNKNSTHFNTYLQTLVIYFILILSFIYIYLIYLFNTCVFEVSYNKNLIIVCLLESSMF